HARLSAPPRLQEHEAKASCLPGQASRRWPRGAVEGLPPARPLNDRRIQLRQAGEPLRDDPPATKTIIQHASCHKLPRVAQAPQESPLVREGLLRFEVEAVPLREGSCPARLAV